MTTIHPSDTGARTGTISGQLGAFAAGLGHDEIPPEVRRRASLLALDAVGVALASGTFDFARRAHDAIARLTGKSSGDATVIGSSERLPLRDAMHLNGILVHGLDYDDTHPGGVIHATSSVLPTALGVAEAHALPGRELLTAYIIGLEVAARLGIAARGAFHLVGFHPTGVLGAFASSVVASRLLGLDPSQIATAQGFVGSSAAGSFEFLETGAWTKRSHPGWAAVCGMTAAAFAAEGFESPPRIYEGRFGLYESHLQGDLDVDLAACTAELGERWETLQVAVKPYPACHLTHAFIDAALILRERYGIRPDDIANVTCRIAPGETGIVCEPADRKRRPASSYDAAFSLPYLVATALVRGRLTLDELDAATREDPDVQAVTDRIDDEPDPDSGYPELFSGELVIHTRDGREVRHREQVNRGAADRPLTPDEIHKKFLANAAHAVPRADADRIVDVILNLDEAEDARTVLAQLAPAA